jgi:ketosteroid isomerase-like protein
VNQTNLQLAQAYFVAVSAGDLPDSLLTPDMTAWTTTQGVVDKARYQNMIRLLASVCEHPIAFTIQSLTAEDDRVVAEARSIATLINGQPYRNTYIFVFRIRDGRFNSIAEHFNPLIVNEQLIPAIKMFLAKAQARLATPEVRKT